MYTKNLLKAKVSGVLLGAASLLMAGSVNAARVDILPVNTPTGAPISLTVTGSEFPDGATSGSIALSWDATVLQLDTTLQQAQIDGILTTGFTDVLRFDATTPGQLLFTAAVGILDPAKGIGGGAFPFLNLSFTALSQLDTSISIGAGPDGDWQSGLGQSVAVTYTGATIGAVPVPAAVWLFGSGLIGMIAVSRRRKPQLVC